MTRNGPSWNARSWCLAASLAVASTAAVAQDANEAAIPVEAAKVIAAPLSEQVTAVGSLLSDESVTVSTEIPGRLEKVHFKEGQPIEKGAPLFGLEDSVYRAQLADAEAKLKLAEQNSERTNQLFSKKYASAQSADVAASNLAVSKAAVELVPGCSSRRCGSWRRSPGLSACGKSAWASISRPGKRS